MGNDPADDPDADTGSDGDSVDADDAPDDGFETAEPRDPNEAGDADGGVEAATGPGAMGGPDDDGDGDRAETTTGAATGSGDVPDDALLQVRNLDAGYGDLQILEDVDLYVEDGEYVTIVGPNGAGKSTVMKSVFGLTVYMGGTITFDGADIQERNPEEIIHEGIGYVPQNDNVFESLTVRENLEMGAYILDEVPEDQIEEVYDRFPILRERSGQKAGTMSGGQRQMLAMGRALMLDPDLLMLDEPSAGLAPDLVDEMFDRIDAINDAGTAVLMVEQNAKEALRRCDRGYVLVQGGNRYMDSGEALLGDEQVRQDFLGG